MKPGIDHHLLAMAGTLAEKIIPAIPDGNYAQGDARMTALLAVMMAQEADRAADTLISENAAMRALFARAHVHFSGDLATRIAGGAASHDDNFRISTLEIGNAALKTVLIGLHAAVEQIDSDWARALDGEIWHFLHKGATDRMLFIPPA
jgi:hypothetical protein